MAELTDKSLIEVRNLMNCMVVFKDEDTHRRIIFQPYELKKLPYDLLRRLNYSQGGHVLLNEYLSIQLPEVALECGVTEDAIEHEYNWTELDVLNLLATGSLDELRDALDFAPEGIRNMIVEKAVDTRVNDVTKRKVIFDMTGIDVDAKISLKEQLAAAEKAEGEISAENKPSSRRAEKKETTNPQRRVQTTEE